MLIRPLSALSRITLASSLCIVSGCADVTAPDQAGGEEVEGTLTGERTSLEDFKRQTHVEGTDEYLVEQDILLDESDLEGWYDRHVVASGALSVYPNGVDLRQWNSTEKLDLTWCVSNDFDTDKDSIRQAMFQATADWERVADVQFRYLPSEDARCRTGSNLSGMIRINVQPDSTGSLGPKALAAANPRRGITVNMGNFKAFKNKTPVPPLSMTGLLRHELGHSLGFGHEHSNNPAESSVCRGSGPAPLNTALDTFSVMYYPQYVHEECTGRTARTDEFISMRDAEGAMRVYGSQSNLVIAGNTIYVRSRSSGDFFRFNGTGFQWVGGPGLQFVGVQSGVYALSPDGQQTYFLSNTGTSWTLVGTVQAGMIFPCSLSSACRTNRATGAVSMHNGNGGTAWTTIGGAGNRFVYGLGGLYAQSPDGTAIFKYSGNPNNWSLYSSWPAIEILGSTSGVYAVDSGTGALLRLNANNTLDVMGGAGSQFAGTSTGGLIGLSPDRAQLYEFFNNAWRFIGGPAKRIGRTYSGTVATINQNNQFCTAIPPNAFTCIGMP
jgi:serralysin